jgi:Trk K+ transport system NAD-binding subunit
MTGSSPPRTRHGLFILLRRLRQPLIVLIVSYAVAILGFTMVPGVTPDGKPWRMDFLHATYFVSFLGSTIGLGEIPYPFSAQQRLWGTFSIYLTVVAWLYSIGALFTMLQDPLLRRLLHESSFERKVRGLREPFFLLCGYDDAGRRVTAELTLDDVPVVVVDHDAARVDAVEVDSHALEVPALIADAADPQALLIAGLRHPLCRGVLALTGDDAVNTHIALSVRLLAPELPVYCAADEHHWHTRMITAGADAIINPFDVFADRMAIALNQPSLHIVYEALTVQRSTVMDEPQPLPRGRWLLCGWGPLSRALRHRLRGQGIDFHVIDAKPDASCDHIERGDPTDPQVLRRANLEEAQLLVAATEVDIDNLAIATAARQLAPQLPVIVRQTQRRNTPLFRASGARLVMFTSYLVASEVLRNTRAPLLGQFLELAAQQDEAWAAALLEQLRREVGEQILESWTQTVWQAQTPAALRAEAEDPQQPLQAVLLMRLRFGLPELLPADDTTLLPGDLLLFAGSHRSRRLLRASASRRTTVAAGAPA